MALTAIWHYFCGHVGAKTQLKIQKLLSDGGVNTSEYDRNSCYRDYPSTCGIVFFDKLSPRLEPFLEEVSHQGLHRIVAVAIENELSSKEVWKLLQCGIEDVLCITHPLNLPRDIAARLKRWKSVDAIIESKDVKEFLIGKSRIWIKALRQIVEIARFSDASILITGESGTGKELIARLIHKLDKLRRKNKFVVLDCTTIAPELSGSEFFGHERGAFTGAIAQRDGAFSIANKGTLFLDEVGELPLSLQAELLRVVQEHTFKRVGGNIWQHSDFRLICATNRDLLAQEERGNFRRDFYHRLATWNVTLPPLRDRVDDIPLLSQYFLEQIYDGKTPPAFDCVVMEYLKQREYPGNVRELYQLIKRIADHHVGDGPITSGDVPECDRPVGDSAAARWRDENFEENIRRAVFWGVKLKEITRAAEESAEMAAILEAEGKIATAAERLGIDKRTLQMHVKEHKQKLAPE